jgi:hypothetical protein
MYELFSRTLSQGLQAFMPVVILAAWVHRTRQHRLASALRWAWLLALPATLIAGWFFERSSYQARWQSSLAIVALGAAIALRLGMRLRTRGDDAPPALDPVPPSWALPVAAAAALIVVRQAMEIAAVFDTAAFELRAEDASVAIAAGAFLSFAAAVAWRFFSDRLTDRAAATATKAFAALFFAQLAFYALHKSAEARFLPWGESIDVATEPYGPDSGFGYVVSYFLVALPLAAASWTTTAPGGRLEFLGAWFERRRRVVLATAAIVVVAIFATKGLMRRVLLVDVAPATVEASTLTGAPHILFRETRTYEDYGTLSVAPLNAPNARRASAGLRCERISFAGGRGICMQADEGLQTTYKAVVFDDHFQPRSSFHLDGRPSRTRVSPDGRFGATTVFVKGQAHGYSSVAFSTQTLIVDMASGAVLADVEQFETWRDGVRIKAADFNFWGVTFARDSNTFYATLQTAGKAYLVRGDLGRRQMTVLRENVECPSLSPNNKLIAFKKKVGPSLSPWRLYVLDLATMKEWPLLAEFRSVDDQIEWLDDAHVLYARPRSSQTTIEDVWVAPVGGGEQAHVFLRQAESPIIVR